MRAPTDLSANHILASLTEPDAQRVAVNLETVEFGLGDVLYRRGENPEHVHFPVDCLIAKLHIMNDGTTVEAAVIGNDGMAGIALFTGGRNGQGSAVVHAAGRAYRMHGDIFKSECRQSDSLHDALLQYTQSLLTQMAQTELCNRYHSIEQQLCRWLLMSLDRAPRNPLVTAHYPLCAVSGSRRESVANVAAKLQKNGAIRYHWGYIEVIDRKKLEDLVCSCYEIFSRETSPLGVNTGQAKSTTH